MFNYILIWSVTDWLELKFYHLQQQNKRKSFKMKTTLMFSGCKDTDSLCVLLNSSGRFLASSNILN